MIPITYVPNFLPKDFADSCFEALRDQLAWVRHGTTPRMEYFTSWSGKPYTYGKGDFARTYLPGRDHPTIGVLNALMYKDYVEKTFELCFLNRYLNQSDHLGWHSDDSPEIAADRPIAIVSLGVEREIWFREIPGTSDTIGGPLQPKIEKIKLHHGSLCLMAAGMQQTHQHRIPKAGFQCGERISLTFRGAAS